MHTVFVMQADWNLKTCTYIIHRTYTIEKKGGVCGEFVVCYQNCPDLL